MALKATIYKATLSIADMDRHYYNDHQLTIAQHPSETDERMMVRLLAFGLNADDGLEFTRGLSTDDEPELWKKSLGDEIELWVELGLPDESRLRKACNRAKKVLLYTYGGRTVSLWWEKHQGKLQRFDNLTIINLAQEATTELAKMIERTMTFQVTIQDGDITVSNAEGLVNLTPETLQG